MKLIKVRMRAKKIAITFVIIVGWPISLIWNNHYESEYEFQIEIKIQFEVKLEVKSGFKI